MILLQTIVCKRVQKINDACYMLHVHIIMCLSAEFQLKRDQVSPERRISEDFPINPVLLVSLWPRNFSFLLDFRARIERDSARG